MSKKNNETPIVVTPEVLSKIAKIMTEAPEGKPMSMLQALNHISAVIAGPKKDWGFLKNAKDPVFASGTNVEALRQKLSPASKAPAAPAPAEPETKSFHAVHMGDKWDPNRKKIHAAAMEAFDQLIYQSNALRKLRGSPYFSNLSRKEYHTVIDACALEYVSQHAGNYIYDIEEIGIEMVAKTIKDPDTGTYEDIARRMFEAMANSKGQKISYEMAEQKLETDIRSAYSYILLNEPECSKYFEDGTFSTEDAEKVLDKLTSNWMKKYADNAIQDVIATGTGRAAYQVTKTGASELRAILEHMKSPLPAIKGYYLRAAKEVFTQAALTWNDQDFTSDEIGAAAEIAVTKWVDSLGHLGKWMAFNDIADIPENINDPDGNHFKPLWEALEEIHTRSQPKP